jgi:uncharacterized protein YidB (DUF937 family)
MSLFTEIVKNALGAESVSSQTEEQTQNLLGGALSLLESVGGIQGLMSMFQQSGLGDVILSWVGTGENQSIRPDQLSRILGSDQISALAQKAGIPAADGANVLAQLLPAMVDKLTPDGHAPESSNLATLGKVLLGGVGAAVAAKVAASYFGKKDVAADESSAAPRGASFAGETPNAASGPAPSTSSAAASDVRTYTVVSGDTLSKISKHFYNDANQWQRIFEANRDILKNPDRIFPGQTLRIP